MRFNVLIPAFLLFLIIIMYSLSSNMYNRSFYYMEFEKNNVQLENREVLLEEVFSGLRGGDMPSFNEKEQMHMQDVAGLVRNGTFLLSLLAVLFALYMAVHYYMYRDLGFLNRTLAYAGIMTIIFIVISILAASHLEFLFIMFHQIFFNNDLWMLNPATDKLIVLFPQQFFEDFVTAVFMRSLSISVVLIIAYYLMKKFS